MNRIAFAAWWWAHLLSSCVYKMRSVGLLNRFTFYCKFCWKICEQWPSSTYTTTIGHSHRYDSMIFGAHETMCVAIQLAHNIGHFPNVQFIPNFLCSLYFGYEISKCDGSGILEMVFIYFNAFPSGRFSYIHLFIYCIQFISAQIQNPISKHKKY